MKNTAWNKISIYNILINFTAVFIIVFTTDIFSPKDLNQWIVLYAMAGSIIFLSYWTIILVPTGHSFSLDSSIYIASLFLYGITFTLYLLFLTSIIELIIHNKYRKNWILQITNFSIYALSLLLSAFLYKLLGGTYGSINEENIYANIAVLVGFAFVNILLVAIYYSISSKISLFSVIKSMQQESISNYSIIFLLSLMLTMVIDSYELFGLFLYTALAALLGSLFKNYYKIYEEVALKASIDNRTGLYNHGYFEDYLEEVLKTRKENKETFSLVIIDIDDFKKFNDTYGHYEGDKLIEFIANHLKASFKDAEDALVARYGGEEFAVILPGIGKEQALSLVNRSRKTLNDAYFPGCEVLPYGCITFSAGIAEYNREIYDKSQLIENADQAMYSAKKRAKNQVQTYPFSEETEGIYALQDGMQWLEDSVTLFKAKDIQTFKHSKRVFKYAAEFAIKLKLDEKSTEIFRNGALIHDIGKIEVPRNILTKKGKLDADEWQLIKMHVTWGREILEINKGLKDLIPLVELHHERYDGRGYPHGLKGEEIPLLARLLCIIDSFDAMTTERPYQKTKSFEEAFYELRRHSGSQFDPKYVEPFIEMVKESYLQNNATASTKTKL